MSSLTLVIEAPRRLILNSNDRLHHMDRWRRTQHLRQLAAAAKLDQAPDLRMAQATCRCLVTYPRRNKADVGNYYPSVKAIVDGIASGPRGRWEWALLPDDDDRHLAGPYLDPTPGETTGNGLYRFTITFEEKAA